MQTETVVYRVEDRDGKGPYIGGRGYDWSYMAIKHNDRCSHPDWWADGLGGSKFFSGFYSLDKLKEWFCPMCRVMLHDLGYVISAYKVSGEIHEGRSKKQIIFDRKQSELVSKIFLHKA